MYIENLKQTNLLATISLMMADATPEAAALLRTARSKAEAGFYPEASRLMDWAADLAPGEDD